MFEGTCVVYAVTNIMCISNVKGTDKVDVRFKVSYIF